MCFSTLFGLGGDMHVTAPTCAFGPISHHAFGTGATAVGAEAIEALDTWETGLPFALVDVFQAC